MNDSALLQRQPIVNRKQETQGYDLCLLSVHGERAATGGVAGLLNGTSEEESFFARLAKQFALADCTQVEEDKTETSAAGRFVLGLRPDETADNLPALVRKWKAAGFGLCLEDSENGAWPPELLEMASFVRLELGRFNGSVERASNRLKKHPAKQIVSGVQTRADFETSSRAGCDLFQGYFFTEGSRSEVQAPNTSYNSIVTLMKLTQDNAPVGKIEEALKRDAALSFKLLRYINSAGFGLSCEIQSFRHAVAVLGYQNLHKWLALLMVTAARQQGSSALITTAIIRGRMAELVGQNLFEPQDRDNLFIVGAFSLLHVILNMPLEKVSEQIALADTITDALFNRAGPYGPILELVEITERLEQPGHASRAAELSISLGLTAEAVNRAQLDALAWAEGMGR